MDPNSTLDITDTPLSQEIIDGTVAHIKALAGRCSTVNVHFLKIDQILSQTALDPENQFSQYRKVSFLRLSLYVYIPTAMVNSNTLRCCGNPEKFRAELKLMLQVRHPTLKQNKLWNAL